MSLIKTYIDLLKCPNSGEDLYISGNFLVSKSGSYKYPLLDENFVELLPNRPYNVHIESSRVSDNNFYHQQLKSPIDLSILTDNAWGIINNLSVGHKKFVIYELDHIKKIAKGLKNRKICIDISGGCGTHTFELAKNFDLVIHFDLWDQSLNYAYHQAKKLGIDNILFVRGDFFNLPFKNCIADMIISIDTFIYYGVKDDIKVLENCQNIITQEGIVMADFHHKKPFGNNPKIHEYSKQEIKYLQNHFKNSILKRFCNVPAELLKYGLLYKLKKIFFYSPFFVRWFLFIYK